MSDKWHFDPRQDYTKDDDSYGNRRGNFQRFGKKKNKKRFDDDFDRDFKGKRNRGKR